MRYLLAAGIAGLALVIPLVRPAMGDQVLFSLSSWTVDGGGYVSAGTASSGAVYTLTSTIAQPDAGVMTGGGYSLGGGFWGTAVGPRFKVYLPMARRD